MVNSVWIDQYLGRKFSLYKIKSKYGQEQKNHVLVVSALAFTQAIYITYTLWAPSLPHCTEMHIPNSISTWNMHSCLINWELLGKLSWHYVQKEIILLSSYHSNKPGLCTLCKLQHKYTIRNTLCIDLMITTIPQPTVRQPALYHHVQIHYR